MARPLTRDQRLQNAAFLKALRRSGNVRLAARECGLNYGTMQHRRARHPAFAQGWDAAVAFANARLLKTGPLRPAARATSPVNGGGSGESDAAFRTAGGEPVVIRLKSGRLQMRRAQPGKVTRQAEQAFLLALSATANVALAAASVGVAQAAFYRRRARNPGFAREMREALAQGYARIELALLERWSVESGEQEEWRDNEPPALPPMTIGQALQLMYLHQKEARLLAEPAHLKRRRGESDEALSYRLSQMWQAQRERDREAYRQAQAARALKDDAPSAHAPPPIVLPDLAQVTGWSNADPAKGGHGDRALFGGWRMDHLTPEQREGGRAKAHEAARAPKPRQPAAAREPRKPGRQLLPGTRKPRGTRQCDQHRS